MSLIQKYVWVIDTLHRTGGLSLKELNCRWVMTDMSRGEAIPRQTFDRWKGGILDLFGVIIECNLSDGYRYYIYNPGVLAEGELQRWLLDAFSTANSLLQHTSLRNRIVVENVPSSRDYLQPVIDAMAADRVLNITYRSYHSDRAHAFDVEPYCIRMFRQRWYLLARSIDYNAVRVYALDRIEGLETTASTFTLPADFDAKRYFAPYYGIILDPDSEEQRIVVRASSYHSHYMRSLPLHWSQREIAATPDYADFELRLRPTFDFCLELLHAADMLEVLEPQPLRQRMHDLTWCMYHKYKE